MNITSRLLGGSRSTTPTPSVGVASPVEEITNKVFMRKAEPNRAELNRSPFHRDPASFFGSRNDRILGATANILECVSKLLQGSAVDRLLRDPRLESNESTVLEAIQEAPWILGMAAKALRDNKALLLNAVSRDGGTLLHASDRLKNDKDVFLAL